MLTLSEEQKFHLIFAQGSESSWEWKYQRDVWNFRSRERKYVGTKVPVTHAVEGDISKNLH